jgi:hypothetical protein
MSGVKGRKLSAQLRKKWSYVAKKHGFGKWSKGCKVSKESAEKGAAKRRGANAYNWKGGVTPEQQKARNSLAYAAWRTAVFERDGYACVNCGDARGRNLNAHHRLSFAAHKELRFEISNGITLCESCHHLEHKERKPRDRQLSLF